MDPAILTFIIVLAALLSLFLLLGKRDSRRREAAIRTKLVENWGKEPCKERTEDGRVHLPGYFHAHPASFQIDDVTAGDLDLDGVYERLDYTQSAAGEEYLYWLLRTPAQNSGQEALREDQIRAMQERSDDRLLYQLALRRSVRCGKFSIYDHLSLLDGVKSRSVISCLYPFVLLAVSAAVMFSQVQTGIVLLFLAISINIGTYYRERNQVAPYLLSLRYVLSLLDSTDAIRRVHTGDARTGNNHPSDADCFAQERRELGEIAGKLADFRRGSFLMAGSSGQTSGNPLDILMDYIRILLHLDLIKFYSMIGQMARYREEIDRMITITGRIDTTISIACFRASLKTWCVPDFEEKSGKNKFEAVDLTHPLLRNPVPNSIQTDGYVLLTGSNASGKSTFLKAAALAAVMAQTLHTVCASAYRGEYYRIYSSMALRDNLSGGESYFIVEIRSLKRILDAGASEGATVLCFIDEVLRGTNTVERIAASSEILKSFQRRGILCFAATHDVELTRLLSGTYTNYHFEEQIENGDILFNYRLLAGPAGSRNAIRLLEAIGYDESIVRAAQNRAEHFLNTGVWD